MPNELGYPGYMTTLLGPTTTTVTTSSTQYSVLLVMKGGTFGSKSFCALLAELHHKSIILDNPAASTKFGFLV